MNNADKKDTRTQRQKFADLARDAECDDDEGAFDAFPKRITSPYKDKRVCPECGHVFQGNGWDGIDSHWRSKHEGIMPYEEAWPLLMAGKYKAR